MASQDIVANSGFSSSAPSRIPPVRPYPTMSMKIAMTTASTQKSQPNLSITQLREVSPATEMESGAKTAHKMTATTATPATANTAQLVENFFPVFSTPKI